MFLFPFLSCNATPLILINLSLASFTELPTKMFQLYMGKIRFDLPMEESKKILAVQQWIEYRYTRYLNKAVAGPISVSSSFKMLLQSFQ